MKEFKKIFEELGYVFPNRDVLEDMYLFYRYYANKLNTGISAVIIEGKRKSGKTFLAESFGKFLGEDTEKILIDCNDERSINESFIRKNLIEAINLANSGKKVVFIIDNIDKAKNNLDFIIWDFLQKGNVMAFNDRLSQLAAFKDFLQNKKTEMFEREVFCLTPEGRKNLYVMIAKGDERELDESLIRAVSILRLPVMSAELVYKILLKRFANMEYDSSFLKFICVVYVVISNVSLIKVERGAYIPTIEELTRALTSDIELWKNGVSTARRIRNLIHHLAKNATGMDILTKLLAGRLNLQLEENKLDDLVFSEPEQFMSMSEVDNIANAFIKQKDKLRNCYQENENGKELMGLTTVLEKIKDDQALVFLNKKDRSQLFEIGTITHEDHRALESLFNKLKSKGNVNSNLCFLNFNNGNFIGVVRYNETLVLVSNSEYVSPVLLMQGLSTIITIIYDRNANGLYDKDLSEFTVGKFKLSGLNVKVLSHIPDSVLSKMEEEAGLYVYEQDNLKVTYDADSGIKYFNYLQKTKAEALYGAMINLCAFNPELALPVSFINCRKYTKDDYKLLISADRLESIIFRLAKSDTTLRFGDFQFLDLVLEKNVIVQRGWHHDPEIVVENGTYVFGPKITEDEDNRVVYINPKYILHDDFMLYGTDSDFEQDLLSRDLSPLQIEIALFAKSIFGNFVPVFAYGHNPDYLSELTMSFAGRIVDDKYNRLRIPSISHDILNTQAFINYYNELDSARLSDLKRILK